MDYKCIISVIIISTQNKTASSEAVTPQRLCQSAANVKSNWDRKKILGRLKMLVKVVENNENYTKWEIPKSTLSADIKLP